MPQTTPTFCLACGYSLSHLPEPRCPECGRPFDPTDPRTMSLAKPLKPWQRRLLKPTSWPTVTFAVLAAILMAWLSGWPGLEPVPGSVLSQELVRIPKLFRLYQLHSSFLQPGDILFLASMLLYAVFLLLFVPRQLARLLVPRAAIRAGTTGLNPRYRHITILFATAVLAACLVFGWQKRIGRRWLWTYAPPVDLSPEQAAKVIGAVIADFPNTRYRSETVRMLVEQAGNKSLPGLIRQANRESDPILLSTELRLISLFRDPTTIPLLVQHLNYTDAPVRAAAADAVGILRQPSYQIPFFNSNSGGSAEFSGVSTIDLTGQSGSVQAGSVVDHPLLAAPVISMDPSVRATLEKMMITGKTAQERQAAARALVVWPPDNYTFRIAEWGVWVDTVDHRLLAKSLRDEIPPFVHRTGNSIDSFQSYFPVQTQIFKPIVHITTDRPLAADIGVQIRQGRPWYAYPCPDDFILGLQLFEKQDLPMNMLAGATPPTDEFPAPPPGELTDTYYGYPWLAPHHFLQIMDAVGPATIYALGIQWQSLIISPERHDWMKPPTAPHDARFNWWSRLREVPCSWVSSRNESERFLYYDGPSNRRIAVSVTLDSPHQTLNFKTTPFEKYSPPPDAEVDHDKEKLNEPAIEAAPLKIGVPAHEGLYVEFHDGALRGQHINIDGNPTAVLAPDLKGQAVENELRQMLTRYGLTTPEAEGLITAWTPQFFKSEGRRFILRMSPDDYARQCPISVRPTPTEVARLGLILTEFDADPPAPPATPPAQ